MNGGDDDGGVAGTRTDVQENEVDPLVRAAFDELANAAETLAGSILAKVDGGKFDVGDLRVVTADEIDAAIAELRQTAAFGYDFCAQVAPEVGKKVAKVFMISFLSDTLNAVCPGRYEVESARDRAPLSYVYTTAKGKCRIKGHGDIVVYDRVEKRWVMFVAMDEGGIPEDGWHESTQTPGCARAAGQAICAAMKNEDRGCWAIVVLTNFSYMRVFRCEIPRVSNGGAGPSRPPGSSTSSNNFNEQHESGAEGPPDDVIFGTPTVYTSEILRKPAAQVAALVSSLSKAMLQVLPGRNMVPTACANEAGDDDRSSVDSIDHQYDGATQRSTAKRSDQQNTAV